MARGESSGGAFRFSPGGGGARGGRRRRGGVGSGPGEEETKRARASEVTGAITAITPLPPDAARWAVRVGRRRVALLDRRGVDELGLAVGMEWTPELGVRAGAMESRREAREYAIRALAFRPRSRAELIDRMGARGFERGVAEWVAEDLERAGLLDDLAFARSFVRSQLSQKAAGRALLSAKLRKKRVPQDVARQAVDEALGEVDQTAAAAALAARRAKTMRKDLEPHVVKRRLYGLLARRGFDPEVCREAVERVVGR